MRRIVTYGPVGDAIPSSPLYLPSNLWGVPMVISARREFGAYLWGTLAAGLSASDALLDFVEPYVVRRQGTWLAIEHASPVRGVEVLQNGQWLTLAEGCPLHVPCDSESAQELKLRRSPVYATDSDLIVRWGDSFADVADLRHSMPRTEAVSDLLVVVGGGPGFPEDFSVGRLTLTPSRHRPPGPAVMKLACSVVGDEAPTPIEWALYGVHHETKGQGFGGQHSDVVETNIRSIQKLVAQGSFDSTEVVDVQDETVEVAPYPSYLLMLAVGEPDSSVAITCRFKVVLG